MFTILFCISRNELRVVDAEQITVGDDGEVTVPHWGGPPIFMRTPPIAGAMTRMDGERVTKDELPSFETADEAWASVGSDYCPSLHP
jgi:hypothetical protein